jgi:tetratricopeptide (TPR) repeat protein
MVGVLLAVLLGPAAYGKTAAELMREALYAEEVEGNLDSAIGIYQQIIADASAPKNLVAQALYREGMCYLKKKNEPDAKAAFQKLVTDYSDQTELVEKVKPMLDELGNADPASLMPPEVLIYVEIGSPGRQVETILNMLKGTPLENPFNAITTRKDPGQTGEHNAQNPTAVNNAQQPAGNGGPVDIVGKIMNPAMMAELKKIRGLGVGLTDIAQNTPPAIIVLFPGQSDALRGLIQMGISMLGQTDKDIEGMRTVKFPDGGGAAFDNSVFIVVSPSPKAAELLKWSVQQYKGATHLPSLASANASFGKISKQARQQNAVTAWVNVAETYPRLLKILPPDAIPQEMQMADGIVNFANVDDLIATISLRQTGVALEANVNFKDGSKSMAYNLIRTPNLNKESLKAVPAEAIALISLALGEAGTAQAQAARDKILSITGQDLGPQVFGNIEQVNLFAMPTKAASSAESAGIPAAVQSLGLVVTSRDPQKTQQLLMTVLQMANLVAADGQQALPASGQYEIALANDMKLFGYTDDASKITTLSLNPQVIGRSVIAMKQNSSVLNGGKLQDAIATMSPKTSKLVLVNVAGAMAFLAQSWHFSSMDVAKQVEQAFEVMAKATEKTTLRLLTSEDANSFSVRLSVSDLPPTNQLAGEVTKLVRIIMEARQDMTAAAVQAQTALCVPQARGPMTMEGDEQAWAAVPAQAIEHVAYTAPTSPEDLSASFKTLWDNQALYLLVDVVDDKSVKDSVEFWLDDCVEVFIDADNSKSGVYGDKDYQYHFTWEGSQFTSAHSKGESRFNKIEGVVSTAVTTGKGYRFKIKFPWSTLGITPRPGTRIGLDVHVNDDDDGGDRDTKIMWHTENDIAWQQPKALGTIELAGLVGWWKLDETGGDKAADSSGNGHDATLHGDPKWLPSGGKIGGALQLDGAGDYADTGYNTDLNTWTAAAWVKSPAAPTSANHSGPVHREKNFQINWNHELEEFRGAAGLSIGVKWYAASFGNLQPDTWYHLAATFDGKSLKAYTNGALVTNNASASGVPDAEPETLKLGRHAKDDSFFAGTIDDVRLYNFGLTEAETQQLYNERK